jgi:hypothetical protein
MEIRDRLTQIIEKYTGRKTFQGSTRLFHDLHLYGEDADDMLGEFQKEFGVDFSEFEFSDYFPDETEMPFGFFLFIFLSREKKNPITIDHLIDVAERQRWFYP